MTRIGDYSFSPQARYIAPERDASFNPVVFRPGGTRFPSIAFWRCRYGYADRAMQPQFAEWLAQDFQELEAYRFGLCIRVLDYLYEEPFGGSPEEREAVLAELDFLVDAGTILHLRVCVTQPEYRHYRLQFFRDHMGTDVGFWRRLGLVYARLAATSTGPVAAAGAGDSKTVWCQALLEEAREFGCPAFTPELIAALVAMQATETRETVTESDEASTFDASEPPDEPVHESVDIPDAQPPAGKVGTASESLEVQEALVNTVNTVIPDSQIADQRSAACDPLRLPALNGAAPEHREIDATEPQNQPKRYVPSVLAVAVWAALIACIAAPPIMGGTMLLPSVRESAKPDHTPCRAPPSQRALIRMRWKHSRGPPVTKNQELGTRNSSLSSHSGEAVTHTFILQPMSQPTDGCARSLTSLFPSSSARVPHGQRQRGARTDVMEHFLSHRPASEVR